MAAFLFIVSFLVGFYGFIEYGVAETVWQQIVAALWLLMAVVLFTGSVVAHNVENVRRQLKAMAEEKKQEQRQTAQPTKTERVLGRGD